MAYQAGNVVGDIGASVATAVATAGVGGVVGGVVRTASIAGEVKDGIQTLQLTAGVAQDLVNGDRVSLGDAAALIGQVATGGKPRTGKNLGKSVDSSTPTAGSKDLKVIGRKPDTDVAKDWEGHDVLDDPDWNMDKNDAWVREGIDNKQDFYTASPREGNMVQTEGPRAGEPTVYSRELEQVEGAGYVPDGDYLRHPDNVGGGGD